MLKEIFLYLTTPVKKELKEGHLYESIALGEKSKEFEKLWKRHYDICKQSIWEHIQKTEAKGICMILGSGFCHDIPMNDLLKRFESLYLVDTVHPKSVRKKFKDNKKINFVEADLTSWSYFLQNHSIEKFDEFTPRIPDEILNVKADFLISDNVMSQLPILPVRKVRNAKLHTEEKENQLARKIISSHYEFIKGKRGMIFTDLRCHFFEGMKEEIHDPLYGFTMPEPIRNWNWELEPLKQTHHVGCWDLSLLK